jgi:predicted ATP-grasp superfamily ATP-dependent carboligase
MTQPVSAPAFAQSSVQSKVLATGKTIGTLLLLSILLPISLLVVSVSLLLSLLISLFRRSDAVTENPKTILLTGGKMTKALQLARSFKSAGHRVVLVETPKYWLSGHRFSNAVDRFYTVPVPEKDPEGYRNGLLNIVKQENVDVFIPVSSPIASYYDSLAKSLLSPYCDVIHFDADITKLLDNKFTFCEKARSIGLSAPKVFLITHPDQILKFDFAADGSQYILKSIPYDSVHRLDMTKLPCSNMAEHIKTLPISPEKPWVMQEFIRGQEYCTHSTVRNGVVRLHGCSKSSAFQVNYEHMDNPAIYEWVQQFVRELNLTGQISFDFIQRSDGAVFPIECNPRIHSAITMFHDHPDVAEAYLTPAKDINQPPIEPLPHSKPTYWLYHELWRLTEIRSFKQLQDWLKKITHGTDAIFQLNDPLPFLTVHHWQIPLLLLGNLRKLKGWIRIDFNIGKLVELGGD